MIQVPILNSDFRTILRKLYLEHVTIWETKNTNKNFRSSQVKGTYTEAFKVVSHMMEKW